MKTSNYITIAYFIFLFGGILTLFIAAKNNPESNLGQNYLVNEKPIDAFSVVIAEPGAKIRLRPGETPKMSLYFPEGDSCTFPPFSVRNDTLFVYAHSESKNSFEVNVYCNNLKSIQEKAQAKVWVEKDFQADSLLVKLENAEFSHFSNFNSPERINLTLIANQSQIHIGETNFDHLDIQLNESNMNVWNNSINNLTGSITNNSNLNLVRFKKISLEADESSRYQFSKNN